MTENEFQPDEIRPGRRSRFKFTQTPQWALLLADLSDAGYRAYSLLLAHVSTDRDDALVWPHQKSLAHMLSKRPEAVSRVVTKELVPLGLVDVEVKRYGANNSRRRNVYTVHEEPPEGWQGIASVTEWYAVRKQEKSETAGQPGHAKNRVSGDAKNRASGHAKNRAGNYTNGELDEGGGKTGGSAGGQAAGGFARAGASDSAAPKTRSAAGGSAADPKNSPPPPKRKPRKTTPVTPARPVAGEEEAWQHLAPVLAELGTRAGTRPPTLRRAVRDLLTAHPYPRRPDHVLARLNSGWLRARGPERSAAGYRGCARCTDSGCTASRQDCDRIVRPIGYLAELLVRSECVRPECERGVLLTTGEECTECEVQAAERAATALAAKLAEDTAALAAERNSRVTEEHQEQPEEYGGGHYGIPHQPTTWRCQGTGCGRVGRGDVPDVPLCAECQEDIHLSLRQGTPAPF